MVGETLAYDPMGELSSQSAAIGGTPVYEVTYGRDASGRITSKSETILGTTKLYEYGYDERGRLADVSTNGQATAHYDYDANGNRIGGFNLHGAIAASYDEQDRLTRYTAGPLTADYAYTVNGELESRTVGNDVTQYTYDVLGNLTQVVLPTSETIAYSSDGRDRRTVRQATGEAERRWLWSGQLMAVAELDAGDAVTSRFVYATRTNVPDYLVRGGITYRILTDQLGSPRLVIDATTPGLTISQRVAQQLEHDEFGNVTTDLVAPGFTRLPFGFAGGLGDPRTGLVRFGARDYDPVVGRWTAKDPIGFEGETSNLYEYSFGDPVNRIDPAGTLSLAEGTAVTGIAASLAGLSTLHLYGSESEKDCVQQFGSCMGGCFLAPGETTAMVAAGEAAGAWHTTSAWTHAASRNLLYPLRSSIVRRRLLVGAAAGPASVLGAVICCEAQCLEAELQCAAKK